MSIPPDLEELLQQHPGLATDSPDEILAAITALETELSDIRAKQIATGRALRIRIGATAFKQWIEENDLAPEFFWLCGGEGK